MVSKARSQSSRIGNRYVRCIPTDVAPNGAASWLANGIANKYVRVKAHFGLP